MSLKALKYVFSMISCLQQTTAHMLFEFDQCETEGLLKAPIYIYNSGIINLVISSQMLDTYVQHL